MGKKNLDKNDYSEATVKAKRKLPVRNIALVALCLALQIALIILTVFIDTSTEPKDRIRRYNITVTPNEDATLNIKYDILWQALDGSEPLTWVDIGIPNDDSELLKASVSDTVEKAEIIKKRRGGAVVRLHFKDEYIGGETVNFGFEIKQGSMLSVDGEKYLYEFVPGWFNAVPVNHFTIRWKHADFMDDGLTVVDGYCIFEGDLEAGEYFKLNMIYPTDYFYNPELVEYEPFDDDGIYNELEDDTPIRVMFILFAVLLIIPEVYIIDSFVSYGRGRGFITEHGHPVHTYGRRNPAYIAAAHAHNTTHYHRGGTGGGGRSCACACACACAGGGRAGCSAKARGPKRENEHKNSDRQTLK